MTSDRSAQVDSWQTVVYGEGTAKGFCSVGPLGQLVLNSAPFMDPFAAVKCDCVQREW